MLSADANRLYKAGFVPHLLYAVNAISVPVSAFQRLDGSSVTTSSPYLASLCSAIVVGQSLRRFIGFSVISLYDVFQVPWAFPPPPICLCRIHPSGKCVVYRFKNSLMCHSTLSTILRELYIMSPCTPSPSFQAPSCVVPSAFRSTGVYIPVMNTETSRPCMTSTETPHA